MAASSAKNQILFFFVVVLFSSNLQIEARESKFFSKVVSFITIHNNDNVTEPKLPVTKEPTPSPSPSPAPAPEVEGFPSPELAPVEAPTPEIGPEYFTYTESGNGYGLYGTQTSTDDQTPATIDAEEHEILSEELVGDDESFKRGYNQNKNLYKYNYGGGNPSTTTNKYYSNNIGYAGNYDGNRVYNNNGYYRSNKPSGLSKNYYDVNNNNNGYGQVERQGMSDTRFLENGRYYHDVKNEDLNSYNNSNDVYESTERESSYKDQGYHGGRENRNEFDTMEEYEKYQESQHYVP